MFPTTFQTETLVTGQDAATVTGLLSLAFQLPSLPSQSDFKLHDTDSTLACLFSSSPSPVKHSSNSVQWKYTLYNPKCSRSFQTINSSLDLLSRAVEYCSIGVLRILQNQMVLNLDFLPTQEYQGGFA